MKVGFASSDWSGSVYDEHGHPVWGGAGWARLGQYVDRLDCEVVAGVLGWHAGVFGVRTWDMQFHWDCDIIVMQRVMFEDVPNKMSEAKASGQILVNDLDDWYWGLSPSNGAFKASHPKHNPQENTNHYRSVMARSSMVTTSTPYLAERLRRWVQCEITILPNCIDTQNFTPWEHTDTEVPLVGWVGSTGHRSGDLEILRGILEPMARRGEIRLHHSGHMPGAPSYAEAIGADPELVSTLPMASPQDYPNLLRFDVGLVPLTDMPFNRAKSAIKGLEYSAAGIPFVASKLDAYEQLQQEHGVGRLARKPTQWIRHLNELRDPEVRKREGELAVEQVKACDVSFGAKRFSDLLHSLR